MARQYNDACGVARALNLVGDRWTLLVVRELLYGPKRFTDLSHALGGVSPNVLTQRLNELVARGIIEPAHRNVASNGYRLTQVGEQLEQVLLALGAWGSRAVPPAPGSTLSTESLLLAMKSTRKRPAQVPPGEYQLDIDGDIVTVAVRGDDDLRFRRGPSLDAVARITTRASTLRSVIFGDRALSDAVTMNDLRVAGDHTAAAALLASFDRPTPFDV